MLGLGQGGVKMGFNLLYGKGLRTPVDINQDIL